MGGGGGRGKQHYGEKRKKKKYKWGKRALKHLPKCWGGAVDVDVDGHG